jgi:hypothetical protein
MRSLLTDEVSGAGELRALVSESVWLMEILALVERSGLPEAWVGAGVIRDLVWDARFGRGFDVTAVKDVDVAFFDPADLDAQPGRAAEEWLRQQAPSFSWDAKNQAAVHLWYPARFDVEVEPLHSMADAVATWPETATAVAVRRVCRRLEVLAPCGLEDLLGGVWRRNPRRVSRQEYLARIERKRPAQRWPGVRVLGPDD